MAHLELLYFFFVYATVYISANIVKEEIKGRSMGRNRWKKRHVRNQAKHQNHETRNEKKLVLQKRPCMQHNSKKQTLTSRDKELKYEFKDSHCRLSTWNLVFSRLFHTTSSIIACLRFGARVHTIKNHLTGLISNAIKAHLLASAKRLNNE